MPAITKLDKLSALPNKKVFPIFTTHFQVSIKPSQSLELEAQVDYFKNQVNLTNNLSLLIVFSDKFRHPNLSAIFFVVTKTTFLCYFLLF